MKNIKMITGKKQLNNSMCPKCGSEEFLTKPDSYEILKFTRIGFKIIKTELTEEEYKIFCRECSIEIDEKSSSQNKKIVLKNYKKLS